MRTLTTTGLVLLLSTSLAHAQSPGTTQSAYRYVDDKGVIHWAQSIHLVPEKYAARAITPDFRDAAVFPPVPAHASSRTTPSGLIVTVQHTPRLESLHGWWASETARIVAAAWKGRGQYGPQPTMAFFVLRDGRLNVPDVERSSGDLAYDLRARDALIALRRLPPLPPDFTGGGIHVRLSFAHVR